MDPALTRTVTVWPTSVGYVVQAPYPNSSQALTLILEGACAVKLGHSFVEGTPGAWDDQHVALDGVPELLEARGWTVTRTTSDLGPRGLPLSTLELTDEDVVRFNRAFDEYVAGT